jgi:tetrahydromethanopterin S-methyltransferase subunit D
VFNSVLLADPIRGIFGSTPVETMQCFRKGMIEVVAVLVLENVPASKKAELDGLATWCHNTHRQTYCRGLVYSLVGYTSGLCGEDVGSIPAGKLFSQKPINS